MIPTGFSRTHRTLALAVMVGAVLFLPAAVTASSDGNIGTIKVHDDMTASPPQRNEPHVSCDFWIEGFKMKDQSGTLEFFSHEPTGDGSLVLTRSYNGTADAKGNTFHFLAGPFQLADGHFRVEAFGASDHPGNDGHFAKQKMFWVEPCSPETPPPALTCPSGLTSVANPDQSVTLSFTPADNSSGTNIYRAVGGGDFTYLATVGPGVGTYTDTTTSTGTTYTYTVTGLFGDRESKGCATSQVTAIPDLPSMLAVGLASIGGIAAYAGFRRRKD